MKRAITFASASILFVVLAGCATPPSGPRIDNLPMYGQPAITRPDFLKKADADFVTKATSGFGGDRRVASKAWAEQATRYLEQHNFDYAMRRFNEAWLLDDANYEAYFGFGRIMVETNHFDDAVKFISRAMELCQDAKQIPALHSDLGVAYSYRAEAMSRDHPSERAAAFALANGQFEKSVSLAPDYGKAWRRWAISLMYEEKFAEALEKVRKAKETGAPPMPPAVLSTLKEKFGSID